MDGYVEYLLNQINEYRNLIKEDPEGEYTYKNVIDELLQALNVYCNFQCKLDIAQ